MSRCCSGPSPCGSFATPAVDSQQLPPANSKPPQPPVPPEALGVHAPLKPRQVTLSNVSGQRLLATLAALNPNVKKLFVIDNFQDKVVSIDRNNSVPDVSHGDFCARIAERRLGRPVQRIDVGRFDASHRGLGYVPRDEAYEAIRQRETLLGGAYVNTGDQKASEAMVDAFHAFRDAPAGHQFEAFANKWIQRFVVK
jgi:hypothetical protein